MSAERIKAKIELYKEVFRGLVLLIIALLGGITTNVYQVITQTKPPYSIVFSIIGGIILTQVIYLAKKLYLYLTDLIEKEL